ncbi:MAG TPA: hypothetical protein VN873_10515 [Candidatus Angelobacter sp.]|nr:hypothetical protein [Candidatus Angelobacter sp.]
MSKYAAKKKLLVAESEVYRQLLKMELQTLNVYARRAKRRATSISAYLRYLPMVVGGVPLLKGLLRRKGKGSHSGVKRLGALLLTGWKAYKGFGPFFRGGRFTRRTKEPGESAAEQYLADRL